MTTSCRPQDPRTRRPKGPPVVDVAILRGGTRVDVGRCVFTPSPFDSGDSSAGEALDQRTLVLCDGLSSDEPAVLRVEELAAAGAPLRSFGTIESAQGRDSAEGARRLAELREVLAAKQSALLAVLAADRDVVAIVAGPSGLRYGRYGGSAYERLVLGKAPPPAGQAPVAPAAPSDATVAKRGRPASPKRCSPSPAARRKRQRSSKSPARATKASKWDQRRAPPSPPATPTGAVSVVSRSSSRSPKRGGPPPPVAQGGPIVSWSPGAKCPRPPCRYYQVGVPHSCRNGDLCRWGHGPWIQGYRACRDAHDRATHV